MLDIRDIKLKEVYADGKRILFTHVDVDISSSVNLPEGAICISHDIKVQDDEDTYTIIIHNHTGHYSFHRWEEGNKLVGLSQEENEEIFNLLEEALSRVVERE